MYFFFFFPAGTDARRFVPPVGTVGLLLMMAVFFSFRYFQPEVHYGFLQATFRPSNPHLFGAVLSIFLHGGWIHLLENSLYLWIFGKQFEGRLGFLPLAGIFLVGGVLACWFQAWFTPLDSPYRDVPLVGASGSIAALLGATLVRFRHQRVRVLYFLFAVIGGVSKGGIVHVNTFLVCLGWFGLQVFHGLASLEHGGAPVAYGAHTGGFVTGLALSLLMGLHGDARKDVHRERGLRYLEKVDWYAAAGEFTSHLLYVPEDVEIRAMRARTYVLLGRIPEATGQYLRLFRDARRRLDVEALARLYREMRIYGVGTNLSEAGLLRMAYEFKKRGYAREAAEVFLELTMRFPHGPKYEIALIRRAEILWSELGEYEEARLAYQQLLEDYPRGEWTELARSRMRSMKALTGGPSPGTSTRPGRPSARPATSS